MSLWPTRYDPFYDDFFDRFERDLFSKRRRDIAPYWRNADHSVLHVANQTQEVVNDDKKFAVELDVSQFKPDEISVHLEDRELVIEGKQEHKDAKGYMHRPRLLLIIQQPPVFCHATPTSRSSGIVQRFPKSAYAYSAFERLPSPLFNVCKYKLDEDRGDYPMRNRHDRVERQPHVATRA
ncbi:Hsp20/alpha crystallin family protein [Oesophagostomum dentatum]|uniref:Hsp20/alpha crystallin family protein n=1 Tax=Oesophagostomum dentatum TaxID=61180 RepID=A0A0B1SSE0_OESDE|nr:Hsp20/alpha crystallin family protein [Oesophagostomum dentatum]